MCRKHTDALAAYGWSAEKTDEIGSLTKSLGSKIAEQAEARISSKGTTKDEVALRADAKELIGRVRISSGLVLSQASVPNVTTESFKIGMKLRRRPLHLHHLLLVLGPQPADQAALFISMPPIFLDR